MFGTPNMKSQSGNFLISIELAQILVLISLFFSFNTTLFGQISFKIARQNFDSGNLSSAFNQLSVVSKNANDSLDFNTYVEAELLQVEALFLLGAKHSALKKLNELENYLRKYRLISELHISKINIIRIDIYASLNLIYNLFAEAESRYRLQKNRNPKINIFKAEFFAFKAEAFRKSNLIDSAHFYSNKAFEIYENNEDEWRFFNPYQIYISKAFLSDSINIALKNFEEATIWFNRKYANNVFKNAELIALRADLLLKFKSDLYKNEIIAIYQPVGFPSAQSVKPLLNQQLTRKVP